MGTADRVPGRKPALALLINHDALVMCCFLVTERRRFHLRDFLGQRIQSPKEGLRSYP